MRTTLDVDDDVLASAKEIARRERKTAGQVLSELARRALTQGPATRLATAAPAPAPVPSTGFVPIESRGAVITSELIRRLRDDGEY
ncbi:MAG: hypothetical protein JSR59_04925 [Proteobacteria bacterium]|nr:hypothetical protein [Pseudomonadota bacterium]